ncbi:hypothetical protein KI387_002476, partial [Taxus chinensis]
MDVVVCCFNARAKQLLELLLDSGFQKYLKWMTNKLAGNELAMIQQGTNVVSYASINALAIRKIFKKYDKILKGVRDKVHLATKFGVSFVGGKLDISGWKI